MFIVASAERREAGERPALVAPVLKLGMRDVDAATRAGSASDSM